MMRPEESTAVHVAAAALSALSAGHLGNDEGRRAQKAACALIADVCEAARARLKLSKNNSEEP